MPEYRVPGIYVEEVSATPKPIEGVDTSTAGFVGGTERGPTEPHLVTSLSEYRRLYGGAIDPAMGLLPHAVQGFFDNGGRRAFVARAVAVPPGARRATAEVGGLRFTAIGPGAWGDRVRIWVLGAAADRCSIQVAYYGDEVSDDALATIVSAETGAAPATCLERFDDLVLSAVAPAIHGASTLVRAEQVEAVVLPTDDGLGTCLAGAEPGGPLDAAALEGTGGEAATATGLAALRHVDGISVICVPDQARHLDITDRIIAHCEERRDRFAILQGAQDWRTVDDFERLLGRSTRAAVYHPWIRVPDPKRGGTVLVPPGGHVAGIFARTDAERGVWKAPANEVVHGIVADGAEPPLAAVVGKREQDVFNPRGVNVIRDFRGQGRGIRLWGARTVSSDPEWKYVNVRRLLIFLESSIDRGTRWVAFEPNDERTWAKVRVGVTSFLLDIWRSGGLFGQTADEAFFVRCDRATMTDADIAAGRLICLVGVAPVRPAEFLILRVGWTTAPSTECP